MLRSDNGRLPGLDILRALAVLVVIGRHLEPSDMGSGLCRGVLRLWARGGWVGVDLFFVLSGFLVAGVLFREYQAHGRLALGRFYVRRGFKIYPAFYVFLFATLLISALLPPRPHHALAILAEGAFLQSYLPGVWNHTWSLAVEEHFYLLLPLVLVALARLRPSTRDPFRTLVPLYLILAVGLLGARLASAALWSYRPYVHHFPTHLRLDALFLGVAVSYGYHFHRAAFERRLRPWRYALIALGSLAFVPPFVCRVERTPSLYTVGFTLLALGSAAILAGFLLCQPRTNIATKLLATIGARSYSIYLWHMPVMFWGTDLVAQLTGARPSGVWAVAFAVTGSVGVGMLMARAVELPVLRLREIWLPSQTPPLATEEACDVQSWRVAAEGPAGSHHDVTPLQPSSQL